MPLLAMFIALEIHSFLSLAFQKEKVNIVSAMRVITKTNDYLVLFEKKQFAKLPCVKHLLSKCDQIVGENSHQNGKLSNSEEPCYYFCVKKNRILR